MTCLNEGVANGIWVRIDWVEHLESRDLDGIHLVVLEFHGVAFGRLVFLSHRMA